MLQSALFNSCVVFVPVDVVKERLQVQRSSHVVGSLQATGTPYKGSLHALRTIFVEEGIRGVYKGYGATLMSFGPFSALYFLFYEQVCRTALFVGIISGLLLMFAYYGVVKDAIRSTAS